MSAKQPAIVQEKEPKRRKRSFFYGGREDSPFKRILIHLALIVCCVIAIYPVLRVFSVSLRPGDRLLSTDMSIIPPDATLESYRIVLFVKPLLCGFGRASQSLSLRPLSGSSWRPHLHMLSQGGNSPDALLAWFSCWPRR